jgi:ankyrin repeat protein
VLEAITSAGVDVNSAIEIADNEGRTPIFEILESITEENSDMAYQVISTLVSPRDNGGYGANVNVVNYQGQSLLFIAVRQAQLEIVKLLVEAGAEPDLHNGKLMKYDDTAPTEYENEREKNLYEAFKLCETPTQLAAVLGYEDILLYLVQECESDINL